MEKQKAHSKLTLCIAAFSINIVFIVQIAGIPDAFII